jgi:OFA family oxalate/formate antiporter-like MFS transporter
MRRRAVSNNRGGDEGVRNVALAVVINMTMGLIYVWGLFLLPLGELLKVDRAQLSLVPSLTLGAFTVFMVIHHKVIALVGARGLALIAFGLVGVGHLLFAMAPGYWTLLIGYGLGVGAGSGLGYGLALALASAVADTRRALAIGLVTAGFAFAGVLLPTLLGEWIRNTPLSEVFQKIGIVVLIVGAAVAVLIVERRSVASTAMARIENAKYVDLYFIKLSLIFFLICYVGLMVVSQVTGMLAQNGLSERTLDMGPSLSTGGYLVGSLFGGKAVELLSGKRVLIIVSALAGLGLLVIGASHSLIALIGAFAVGITFGSSASLMPVLIGEHYGVEMIGPIYGKMIIAYGLAGLIAPWANGALFSSSGDYKISIFLGVALCGLSALLGFTLASAPAADKPRR